MKTASVPPSRKPSGAKVRMTGQERREQLLNVGRKLFAEKGFETVTVEEIAAKADVSKPVVYEHFGGKEGLYAVVVDREMNYLLDSITQSLMGSRSDGASARELVEQAGMALFNYIDSNPQGFSILVRDSPVTAQTGSFASLMLDIATQVEDVLAAEFKAHGINDKYAPMYSQMLVGMVAFTGQWWLDVRKPKKEEVVAHLVNLAWNGLRDLDPKPTLTKQRKT
ncbi:MAG: TetR/AcrR family transcriptional regulator [Candidatus Nanopelagicales bacterium]|nr:TetR/AcrR family transcriptional regulator [Actinomycetota bacterium]MDB0039025.1 TetR/AcrR family transcriptional regulator [Actinomycetota bacterium]